eukprot:g1532.t1
MGSSARDTKTGSARLKARRSPTAPAHTHTPLRPAQLTNSKSKYEAIGQTNYAESHYTEFLKESVENHVGSFNLLLDHVLEQIPHEIVPIEISASGGSGGGEAGASSSSSTAPGTKHVLPSDCREGHFTYSATCRVRFWTQKVGEKSKQGFEVDMGKVPVMVGSKVCHLHGLSPKELVQAREDETERGGYFIMNGNERVIRLLIMPKANQLLAIDRGSFTNRGDLYTKHAVQIRCMRRDLTTLTNTLHYCRDGSCFFRFSHNKNEFLIPMLMAKLLCGGNEADNFSSERVQVMFQTMLAGDFPIHRKADALQFLGDQFRQPLQEPAYFTDADVGLRIVRQFILVNSTQYEDKFSLFCLMFQKLMRLAEGKISPENCDALSTQEALLPGQLYGAVLKEAVEGTLLKAKLTLLKKVKYGDDLFDLDQVEKVFWGVKDVDHAMNYFLSTGTIKSRSGLDLMQVTGFTIVADKLNAVRYLSHFRAIHRGQFFMEMKTTAVRKLLPDSWGFLCPVHTPDGGPCGLLNHLSQNCQVALTPPQSVDDCVANVRTFLQRLGVLEAACAAGSTNTTSMSGHGGEDQHERYLAGGISMGEYYPVVLEGRVLGYVRDEDADKVVGMLRRAKTMSTENKQITKKLWKKLMTVPAKPEDLNHASKDRGTVGAGPMTRPDTLSVTAKAEKFSKSSSKKRAREEEPAHTTEEQADEDVDSDDDVEVEGAAQGSSSSGTAALSGSENVDSEDSRSAALTIALSSVTSGPVLQREAEAESKYLLPCHEELFKLVPHNLEIAFVDRSWDRIFPGIFLFVGPCRFTRPVRCLRSNQLEHIGPFEQLFLKIAVTEAELVWARKVLRADIQQYARNLVAAEKRMDKRMAMLGDGAGGDLDGGNAPAAGKTSSANKSKQGSKNKKLRSKKASNAANDKNSSDSEASTSASTEMEAQQQRSYGHCDDDMGHREAVGGAEMEATVYTHREIDPIKMLSIIASLTPFQNHNQSPRCMYQCQMLKQTMGTPYQNHARRTDNKVYKIQFPQRPMVRAQMYADAKFDTHPTGMNAIVAVCAYTGYDMEDAMIINKMSYDRGFMAGNVYKQKIISCVPEKDAKNRNLASNWAFSNWNVAKKELVARGKENAHMQLDGTPKVGLRRGRSSTGMVLVTSVNKATGEEMVTKYKDADPCWLENITVISGGSFAGRNYTCGNLEENQTKLSLKLRYNRRPMVGDKFATRHGQKGVMATLWQASDMPFSARGMVPDILFNPHGFPSRMTIGQLIESMAGKAAALTGTKHVNATAFRKYRGHFNYDTNNEDDPFLEKDPVTACDGERQPMPAEYFGRVLKDYG